MTKRDEVPLDRLERVTKYPDRQSGVSWPLPIDVKVDRLLQQARDAGERTSRREIVAAVVFAASFESGEALGSLLRRYRLASVDDLLEPVDDGDNVLAFRASRPGPRAG